MSRQRRHDRNDRPPDDEWLARGFTSVPGFLTDAEIATVRSSCDRILADKIRHQQNDKIAGGTQRLSEVDKRIDLVADIAVRPALLDLVRLLVGEHHREVEATFRNPRPGYGHQRLHTDDVTKLLAGPDRIATVIVALVDFTKMSGPTRVVPGSHRRPDLQRITPQLEDHPDELLLTGVAGTAFVFSGHLLHSGTTNRSADDRPALQLMWRRSIAPTS